MVHRCVAALVVAALVCGCASAAPGSGVAPAASGGAVAGPTFDPVDAAPTLTASPAALASPAASSSTPAALTDPTPTPTPKPTPKPTATPAPPPKPAATPASTSRPSPSPTPKPPPPSACAIFPATNAWNTRVDNLPVDPRSDAYIAAIGLSAGLHPDFSDSGGYGIPYNIVGAGTPDSTVRFQYADESDRTGYPIPAKPKIEGGSDRHLVMVDTSACRLYELYDAINTSSGWTAGSGATWDLRSNKLRPDGWTSADAAGLPILPGLARADEVLKGVIAHALRFTAPRTCAGHIAPARHDAGSGSCDARPPMGLRVRLKASVDLSGFGPQARVVLVALQRYGMLLADNGSAWYITGAPDSRWNDDDLHALGRITGADLEVVDTSGR